MIVYFADRQMQVLGLASTNLPKGFVIIEDLKTEEIETGVATFSCRIGFNDENRIELESMTNAGNYVLRSHDGENEFYTIIDTEIDTKNKTINIYAEDAGLDLLNEVAGEFEATESQTAVWYINKYIADSGFEIGINEIPASHTRKLKWEGEETVTARLASIAKQFDGYEISYSFDIKGLTITNKYVNIHKERGKDVGITLRLNQDIDKIITSKSVANLATAFVCEGGVPDKAEEPITLSGYQYDDGDFFVDGDKLKSRKANEKWSRYVWNKEPNKLARGEGYIVRPYSYNTTDQQTLCSHAITELKKVCDMEVNYEIDIKKLPANVKIGDRINIVDDAGELYVSTRILMLESSVTDQKYGATLGEHIIKTSGISQKVLELAEQFAQTSISAAKALSVANAANNVAKEAQTQAEEAAKGSSVAITAAQEAQTAAENATKSANDANIKANAAQEAIVNVAETVSQMEQAVTEAEELAESAKAAADSANTLSEEAKTNASNAETKANEVHDLATSANELASEASSKADTARTQAGEAKTQAQAASETAAAAKAESEQAQKDIETWAEDLETYKASVTANYAKKTDLTETSATLQAQITANANQLEITHSKVLVVDETANNAKELAESAQTAADAAQTTAEQATADAEAAQTKADQAQAAADAAQTEANNAKAAAEAAQGVADQAEADLATAKANLESVTSRVGATEQEIADAQAAVNTAQQAADKAKADAATAAQKAEDARSTADTAVTNAATAQTAANDAASKASAAQATANEAKGNASAAQATANEAKTNAANAQATANTALTNAATAQAQADQAALDAATAQQTADEADAKAAQAKTDLDAARQNLADTISRVDATEEEIAAAEKAVEDAKKAADDAQDAAEAAQSTADTAKTNAANAQTAADNAKTAADNAKKAADDAKDAADRAQAAADALVVRVTQAETDIVKNSEQIALRATKTEVDAMVIGGRNLILNSSVEVINNKYLIKQYTPSSPLIVGETYTISMCVTPASGVTDYRVFLSAGYKKMCDLLPSGTEKQILKETFVAGYYTGRTPEDDLENANVYIYRIPNDGTATGDSKIHWVKLEKGNKATDWTPAPEDVDSKFLNYYTKVETNSELSVMSGEIAASVSRIEGVEARATGLEQTSQGFTARVSALENTEIGGRNLFRKADISTFGSGTAIDYESTDKIVLKSVMDNNSSVVVFNRTYTAGTYTINIKGSVSGNELRILSNKQLDSGFKYVEGYNTNVGCPYYKDASFPATFTFPDETKICFGMLTRYGLQTISGVKLEKGNKATDWTPAPEDVDESISNVEDTAGEAKTKADALDDWKVTAQSEIKQLIDKISMLVVGSDGSTLWEQTEEGWSFNFADAKNAINATNNNAKDISDLSGNLATANQSIEQIQDALKENAEYIRFTTVDDGNGGTEPCIELGINQKDATTGEVGEGKYKVLITNTRIIFKEGSATPTYISNETLVSEKVEVTQELQQTNPQVTGRFVWQMRKNGNYGLSWKGE